MPLGTVNILPFLKGWGYAVYRIPTTTITRGDAPIEVFRVDEEGVLWTLTMASTDAYAALNIEFQGADLQPYTVTITAEAARTAGMWQQDPTGYIHRYYRPLQASTAGIYFITVYSGTQGFMSPYYRSIVAKVYLDSASTQSSASISSGAAVIRFTDKKSFIHTYRKFMGIKEKEIASELLEVGH